ncbi:MAG TPA: GMC family oxidoreductase [Bryobacteraceae bacterium]|jgi:choline dehydrogenase-like flavoprotein|nr:GMC family oxidoreductase [Bryobacteraceae bacterium]HVW10602.1 GMC family oxidoreductase [Bryobacteraceae bacterium]
MQIVNSPDVHDVIVIGSGAAGGMAAWNLTRQGVNVLLLDAGTKFNRAKFWTHVKPWEWRKREARGQHPVEFELSPKEQPYLTPPGRPFELTRVWGRGGKTNIWGRVALRYSDLNFTEPGLDGWEIPWPIRYKDLAPYYDKVDQTIGVNGGTDDEPWLPGSQHHLPPPNPRCGEYLIRGAAHRAGVKVVAGRRAVVTRPLNGHPACHLCGACGRGCDIGAFFNSSDYLLEPAFATGRLTVVDNAVVARILVDDRGLASGVQYFDRHTKAERQVHGKRVVVGASCVDSTRILLNSKSERYPNGIGNGSDVIGRFLSEQIRFHMSGFVPELLGGPTQNDDGIGGAHIYMPRFVPAGGKGRDYLRGFGMQFWGFGAQSGAGFGSSLPGYGVELKKAIKRRYPALVALHPYGEVLPRRENRITVEGTPTDAYGVPIARIEYAIGENERKMAEAMYDTCEQILHEAKAEILPYKRGSLDVNGGAIHEHGTCRMGDDPKRSALNGFCQSHEVKNLFVVDGSSFPTATEKNPTLSILAVAWRATDYLAEEIKAGRV